MIPYNSTMTGKVESMFEKHMPDWLRCTKNTEFKGQIMAMMGYRISCSQIEDALVFRLIRIVPEGRQFIEEVRLSR